MTPQSSPMPPAVKEITVNGQTYPLYEPFYYGSLNSFYVYYPVASAAALQALALPGFTPYRFSDGFYAVTIDFQSYTAQGGAALETTNEVEFNLLVTPTAWRARVPELSLKEYLHGEDQTKTIGHWRIHVPCDNPFAVAAGKALYTEPKFLAQFEYLIPALNLPVQHVWSVTCSESGQGSAPGPTMFKLTADVRNADHSAGNPTPIIEFGLRESRPVVNYWNLFGPLKTFCPLTPETQAGIQLSLGPSDYQNVAPDMRALIGDGKPVAVQIFNSPPCSSECRPAYCDID